MRHRLSGWNVCRERTLSLRGEPWRNPGTALKTSSRSEIRILRSRRHGLNCCPMAGGSVGATTETARGTTTGMRHAASASRFVVSASPSPLSLTSPSDSLITALPTEHLFFRLRLRHGSSCQRRKRPELDTTARASRHLNPVRRPREGGDSLGSRFWRWDSLPKAHDHEPNMSRRRKIDVLF